MDKVPKNCAECEHRNKCKSWYGGTICKFKDYICNNIIKKD